ncbi:MAG: DsbA family protein [Patescibacteria group bacterium]|jgi:protein-disulfide isomerase
MTQAHRNAVLLTIGILLIVAGTIGYLVFSSLGRSSSIENSGTNPHYSTTQDPLITKVDSVEITLPSERQDDFIYGNTTAAVTIFEFSDFACPYCRVMASLLKQAIDENPGVVKLIWRDFPINQLHPEAASAHLAARCAGAQGKFWEFHDQIFAAQELDRTTFLTIAQNLHLNPITFSSCLQSDEAKGVILKNIKEGNALGVDGTPYLFIGDQRISGLLTAEELNQVIQLHKTITP